MLRDESTGMRVEFAAIGASNAPGEFSDGYVVYPDGLGEGMHVLHRPSSHGTEDFVVVPRPGTSSIRYDMVLNDTVAGLRLVGNTLEFLAASGVPILRVAPPVLVDRAGTVRDATLSVAGCDILTDPKIPSSIDVIAPGSENCELSVSWQDEGLEYPLLVDPQWSGTILMATARTGHTMLRAQVGFEERMLAAGGSGTLGQILNSAEVLRWQPGQTAWQAVASMTTARTNHLGLTKAAPPGQNDLCLVAGGWTGTVVTNLAARFNPATGTWSATGSMQNARQVAGIAAVSGTQALVAGGLNNSLNYLATAELYNWSTGTWALTTPMVWARAFFTLSQVGSGSGAPVLAAGGVNSIGWVPQAERYLPGTGWDPQGAGVLAKEVYAHAATNLISGIYAGCVVVSGGIGTNGLATRVLQYWCNSNPNPVRWALFPGSMGSGNDAYRAFHTATRPASSPDKIMFAGGINAANVVTSSSGLLDTTTAAMVSYALQGGPRQNQAALPRTQSGTGGRVVISGGYNGVNAVGTSEEFVP